MLILAGTDSFSSKIKHCVGEAGACIVARTLVYKANEREGTIFNKAVARTSVGDCGLQSKDL